MTATVGLVGARGYVGGELVRLLAGHPALALTRAASRQGVGTPLAETFLEAPAGVVLEDMSPQSVGQWPVDVVVLALPNGLAPAYAEVIKKDVVIVDLSADHRFADEWAYGLPELHRARIAGARRIANPGCYATGIQLGVAPVIPLLAGPPQAFGVSGYSGAGTTPGPRNDPARLRDNMMAYSLIGHVHEREATRHLRHPVRFTPHVAAFFRGISLTITLPLAQPTTGAELLERCRGFYGREPLVRVLAEIPEVRAAAGCHDVKIGGFEVDGTHAVLVVTLDNLLKGAASQALQNINLALGLPELGGIPYDETTVG